MDRGYFCFNNVVMDIDKFIKKGWEPQKCYVGKCECCGKRRKLAGTSFVCGYCLECHKINIEQSNEAVKQIKKR